MAGLSRDSVQRFPALCPLPSWRSRCILPGACLVRAIRQSESRPRHRPKACYPCPLFVTSSLAPAQSIRKPGRRSGFLFFRRPRRWRTFRCELGAGAVVPEPSRGSRGVSWGGGPRAPLWGLIPGPLDFPGINWGRGRMSFELSRLASPNPGGSTLGNHTY